MRRPAGRTPAGRSFGVYPVIIIPTARQIYGEQDVVIPAYRQIADGYLIEIGTERRIVEISPAIIYFDVLAERGSKLTEDLYFIDEPVIEVRGRIATHVIVESPTHSYTSSLPGIATENIIERRVLIEVGNEETCKLAGERLLEKWGRVQKSVSGEVPLVVTTKFREKMNVWIPISNIDELMILQRKVHNIGTGRTRLVLGDIILSEQEHIARVLQSL